MLAIESFLALVDRLIALATKQTENRHQVFVAVIDPMFSELQGVVDQYFSLFWDGRKAVRESGGRGELEAALEKLRQTHERVVHARSKVLVLAQEIGTQISDKRIVALCEKIARLFESAEWSDDDRKMSPGRRTIQNLENLLVEGADRGSVLSHIDRTLRHMEDRWIAVAQSYASVRLHCLR